MANKAMKKPLPEGQQIPVSENEYPYKLPRNWQWTRLKTVLSASKERTDSFTDSTIKYIGLEHMRKDTGIVSFGSPTDVKSTKNIFHPGQILYGKLRPYLNKHDVATFEGICSTDIIVFNVLSSSIPQYVNYYLDQKEFIRYAVENSKGINLPRVSEKEISSALIPLPPLPEQHRIVKRIQSLFTKLDEAKDWVQSVLDGYEDRKTALLYSAFSGELTAKWRKEKKVTMDTWRDVVLSDVCKVNPPKANTKDLSDDLEVSFFPMPSLSEECGEITKPQTRKLREVRSGFTSFIEGDVVFAKITPCMENGKSAIIGKLLNDIGFGTTEFYVLRCSEELSNRYLWHMLRDRSFREKAKAVMTGAVGQQRVPKSFLEEYPIQLPLIDEQNEIVKLLDNALKKEQIIIQNAENVINQIDIIKNSILTRAFRGELGTNDPTELPISFS